MSDKTIEVALPPVALDRGKKAIAQILEAPVVPAKENPDQPDFVGTLRPNSTGFYLEILSIPGWTLTKEDPQTKKIVKKIAEPVDVEGTISFDFANSSEKGNAVREKLKQFTLNIARQVELRWRQDGKTENGKPKWIVDIKPTGSRINETKISFSATGESGSGTKLAYEDDKSTTDRKAKEGRLAYVLSNIVTR